MGEAMNSSIYCNLVVVLINMQVLRLILSNEIMEAKIVALKSKVGLLIGAMCVKFTF